MCEDLSLMLCGGHCSIFTVAARTLKWSRSQQFRNLAGLTRKTVSEGNRQPYPNSRRTVAATQPTRQKLAASNVLWQWGLGSGLRRQSQNTFRIMFLLQQRLRFRHRTESLPGRQTDLLSLIRQHQQRLAFLEFLRNQLLRSLRRLPQFYKLQWHC